MPENPDLDAVLRLARTPTPMPEPEGCVVRVTDVDQLRDALESADPNTTILVAAGRAGKDWGSRVNSRTFQCPLIR